MRVMCSWVGQAPTRDIQVSCLFILCWEERRLPLDVFGPVIFFYIVVVLMRSHDDL